MRDVHNTAAITVLGVVGLMFFGIGLLIALVWAFVGQTDPAACTWRTH